jgi:hypothetical protein
MPNVFPYVASIQSGVNLNLGTRAEPLWTLENVGAFFANSSPSVFAGFGDLPRPKVLDVMLETGEFGLPLVPDGFLPEDPDGEEVGFDVQIAGTQVATFGAEGLVAFPQDETRPELYLAWYCFVPLEEGVWRLLEVDSGIALKDGQMLFDSVPRISTSACYETVRGAVKVCARGRCAVQCRQRFRRDPTTGVKLLAGCRCPAF